MTRRRWLWGRGRCSAPTALAACGADQAAPGARADAGGRRDARDAAEHPRQRAGHRPVRGRSEEPHRRRGHLPRRRSTPSGSTTYYGLTQVRVNYQSIGSGGGIKAISDQTVDFGATDGADDRPAAGGGQGRAHLPHPHRPGRRSWRRTTSPRCRPPPACASPATPWPAIFLGEIKKWNDPKLKADNPSVGPPGQGHRHRAPLGRLGHDLHLHRLPLHRQPEVEGRRSATPPPSTGPGGLGGKGNEGVTGEVKQNPYSIGYVEYIYAKQNKLGYAEMKNKAGAVDLPRRARGHAPPRRRRPRASRPTCGPPSSTPPGAKSYPISGFTWMLAYQKHDRPGQGGGADPAAVVGDPRRPALQRRAGLRAPCRWRSSSGARSSSGNQGQWHSPPSPASSAARPADAVREATGAAPPGAAPQLVTARSSRRLGGRASSRAGARVAGRGRSSPPWSAIFVLLAWDSRAGPGRRFGFSFFTTSTWDTVKQQFGDPALHLRHADDQRRGHRCSASPVAIGAALFVVEYCPSWLRTPDLLQRRAAGGDPQHHLRPVGLLRPLPVHARLRRALPAEHLGPTPGDRRALLRARRIGKDLLTAGVILAIMILPTIMAVSREVILTVPDAQREGMLGAGRHQVGDDHQGGAALRALRASPARPSWAWPGRWARRWP